MVAEHDDTAHQALAMGLLAVGVLARFFPHPPNVTPIVAVALLGGTYLSKGLGLALPLLTIVLSDVVLGLHEVVAFTWGSVVLIALLGWWIRKRPRTPRVLCAAWAGSSLFFLVSNFGVWLVGHSGTMYPKTAAGLWECYVAALPFYRNALLGDLASTLGLFALYAWTRSHLFARSFSH